jgi:predicted HAD superfamily Cof-like phosphohydrolase
MKNGWRVIIDSDSSLAANLLLYFAYGSFILIWLLYMKNGWRVIIDSDSSLAATLLLYFAYGSFILIWLCCSLKQG